MREEGREKCPLIEDERCTDILLFTSFHFFSLLDADEDEVDAVVE